MTAIVSKSKLNPFATCFVPSSCKALEGMNKSVSPPIVSPKKKASNPEILDMFYLTCPYIRMLQLFSMEIICGDSVSFQFSLLRILKWLLKPTTSRKKELELPMLPESKSENDQKNNQNTDDSPEFCMSDPETEEREECHCPAMFGWIIPPHFMGNPLNLNYHCNKKHAHIGTSQKSSPPAENWKSDSLDDTTINELTMDQCFHEMENIIVDVCESIADPDPISGWDDEYKIKDFLELSDEEPDDAEWDKPNRLRCVSLPTPDSSNKAELFEEDDGCHPLLQSDEPEEGNFESIERVERILGGLSPVSDLLSSEFCDIPCSQWCDEVPSAAKATFKKFLKDVQLPEVSTHENNNNRKPIYKRSFSADDSQSYSRFDQSLFHPTSVAESRERLILLRKDPLSYFRHHASDNLKDGGRQQWFSCSNLFDHKLLEGSKPDNGTSSKWGPFDGADSLWQPLPDCVPANEYNQKQNCHKRAAREMKRQRSINKV